MHIVRAGTYCMRCVLGLLLVCFATARLRFGDQQGVPRSLLPTVHRCYPQWQKRVPAKVFANERQWARGYRVRWWGASEARAYVALHGGPRALAQHDALRHGANRGDMFRYLLLWREGGVWLDADVEMLAPLARMAG